MYKKVINDDGHLESLNDKRASCILLMNGLSLMIELLRSRIFTLQELELLEDIVCFTCNINNILNRCTHDYSGVKESVYAPRTFYPLIRQARQMEIFSLLCGMNSILLSIRKNGFFRTCNQVHHLNQFLRDLKPSIIFLQKFVVDNKHFHVVIPPPEPKCPKYIQKYY